MQSWMGWSHFTIQRGKMHPKDLRNFHNREPKLLVNLELAALLGGKLGVVQKMAWLLNSAQSTLFPAHASSIRTWI